jgi:hypothetical protein
VTANTVFTSIVIGAAFDRAWQVLIDLDAYGTWNPYLVRIEPTGDAQRVLVHQRINDRAEDIVNSVEIVRIEPWTMHWHGTLGEPVDLEGDHFFELRPESADRIVFDHWERFSGPRADQFIEMFSSGVAQNFERFNLALKDTLERFDRHELCSRNGRLS